MREREEWKRERAKRGRERESKEGKRGKTKVKQSSPFHFKFFN